MKTTKKIGLARVGRIYTEGVTRPATHEEASLGLALKLHEEVAEVVRAPNDVAEYADVLQALVDYAKHNGVLWGEVLRVQAEKAAEAGTFLPALLWRCQP